MGAVCDGACLPQVGCKSAPCYGSRNHDKIYERPRNGAFDKIIMRRGHDLILANG